MINKINILPIITGHLKTLKDAKHKRYLKRDIIGFYFVPLASGFLTSYFYGNLIKIDTSLICYTILIPLLVNILFLIYSILERNSSASKNNKYVNVLRQLYANLSYAILISICSLLLLLSYSVFDKNNSVAFVFSSILYFLFYHIVLTSFMILKRLHILLQKELNGD